MTEKLTRTNLHGRYNAATSIVVCLVVAAFVFFAAATVAQEQQPDQQPGYPAAGANFAPAANLVLPPLPTPTPITPDGSVVEDAVARINDQVITRTEYEASEQQLLQQARQDNLSQNDLDDRLHNLLRDMIDEQLLLSKGKELGITADAETMRELDDIRKRNHLASMQDLENAAAQQGVSFEDFKQHIRDQLIRQQVVRDEVGAHLSLTHAAEAAYYNAHRQDFMLPEQVHLSEILIPTPENPTQTQIDSAEAKANLLVTKLQHGANFAALARTYSGGPTASDGGDLGDFKRGALGDILEKATFSLPVGGNTPAIRTRQGYVILHVDSHQQAGVPPLSAVEDKVEEALYFQQLQPALRAYLTKARSEAYMEIAPGFVDTGSPTKKATTQIAYTAYTAAPLRKKVLKKQRLEQEKANRAQVELAAARERLAAKEAARAAKIQAKASGKKVDVSYKRHKIHREKIRYGQAPEEHLSKGTTETAQGGYKGAPIAGVSPNAAMSSDGSIPSITTGTSAEEDIDPFAAPATKHKKYRITALESQAEERSAKKELAKDEAKSGLRPIQAAPTETATEKLQATPLGLNGDTVQKKKHKHKRKKNEVKQRMRERQKAPKVKPTIVAPTVNPDLAAPINPPAPPPPTSGSSSSQ